MQSLSDFFFRFFSSFSSPLHSSGWPYDEATPCRHTRVVSAIYAREPSMLKKLLYFVVVLVGRRQVGKKLTVEPDTQAGLSLRSRFP